MVEFYKDKKCLVTGSSGLVGTNLVKALKKEGAIVTGASLENDYDLRDMSECQTACLSQEGGVVDYVFHCAAASFGAKVMKENPLLLVADNIRINLNMLQAASEAKVKRFLFISSSTVYPNGEWAMEEHQSYSNVFEGYFGVGNMKRISETMCKIYHKLTDMKIAIVRPVNMYGPHDKFDPEISHVLPALIRRAVNKEDPFVVWGAGKAIRDFMYIDDAVKAMILVLEKKADCDPINIGTGEKLTIKDAVNLILKCTNQNPLIRFELSKPEAIQYRMLDLQKQKELGFEPEVSFEEGIRRTIEWYKKQKH